MFNTILDSFEPIDIFMSTDKSLQTRYDRKFTINASLLPLILDEIKDEYQCQTINGLKVSTYESNYYDTIDLQAYHHTRIKRPNRYKVRRRLYHNGNLSFLELKKKVKGGKTVKERVESSEQINNEASVAFLKENNIDVKNLSHVINVFYNRFTLISNTINERITIDTDIYYECNSAKTMLNNIAIIEIKQEKISNNSKIYKALSSMNLRPLSFSKYCLGMGLTQKEVNTKGFNKKLNKVKELINS